VTCRPCIAVKIRSISSDGGPVLMALPESDSQAGHSGILLERPSIPRDGDRFLGVWSLKGWRVAVPNMAASNVSWRGLESQ
jgi:hypothetical protein